MYSNKRQKDLRPNGHSSQGSKRKIHHKKVRTRLKYKNQDEKTFLIKIKYKHKIGTKAIKIKMGNEFGGHEIKNSSADNKQKRICLTNLIFYNSIAINCFNLLQI